MGSFGVTVPFSKIGLRDHEPFVKSALEMGYEELWSSEVDCYDAFSPLITASGWSSSMRLGTAIVPTFTRGPATLAMSISALCDVAPGRVSVGLGSSSNVIVERWNSQPFVSPFQRTRDTVRFLREALSGARVDREYETFSVSGFKLLQPPSEPPEILVAALREQMLKMSSREADGVVLNWLSPSDVTRVSGYLNPTKKVVARIFVCPSVEVELVRAGAKRLIATYMNVPVYAEFQRWLGRGERLEKMWTAWSRGDRKEAARQVPNDVVDELIVHGSPESCKLSIEEYFKAGVDVAAIAFLPFELSEPESMMLLGRQLTS